jgi:hypothetical protein
MTTQMDPLDRLAPGRAWIGNWEEVLQRADMSAPSTPHRRRVFTRRRLVFAFAVLVCVLVPLVALGGANDWWFLRDGQGPTPQHAPVVVKEGEWNGHHWQLVAYASTTDGVCYVVNPSGSESGGFGGAMGCAPIAGVPRTDATKRTPDMTITYMGTSGSQSLAWVAGPVIETAKKVEIKFPNGRVLRVATFPAPESVGRVRFYATPLPADVMPTAPGQGITVVQLRGLDQSGNVVACLVPESAIDGISPLSDCSY